MRKGAAPSIRGGGPYGLPGLLFYGAEFGGGGDAGSPGGRRTNGRRSTKQFGAHTGTAGRWFMPNIRSMFQQMPGWMDDFLDDVIGGAA